MIKFTHCQKKPRVQYPLHPRFGTVFAPHLLRMNFHVEQLGKTFSTDGLTAEILPFERELFSPATIVLHYGQSIFEGLKAYRMKDGSVAAFRADLHARRFMSSAQKLAMPVFGEELFMTCLMEYLKFEQDSVPSEEDHSLYLRPLLIGRDEIVKIGRSKNYTFYILASVAGSYFQGGPSRAARVLVNKTFVRAFPGGLGEAKTAGNYAASLGPQAHAETLGCDQVLYLDALRHEFVDELGGMNFFIVKEGELITPPLLGTVLHGVTRRSILEIAATMGLKTKEAPISIVQFEEDLKKGAITEAFACGTAAVVHSIGELLLQEQSNQPTRALQLPAQTPTATKIRDTLTKIQRGRLEAPGRWLFPI